MFMTVAMAAATSDRQLLANGQGLCERQCFFCSVLIRHIRNMLGDHEAYQAVALKASQQGLTHPGEGSVSEKPRSLRRC